MTAQPSRNDDLHGNAPDHCPVALLLIDVINDLEWEGGELIEEAVVPMAHRIAELKSRAAEAGVPVIYVNDNFGRWKSDFRSVVEHCLDDGVRGEQLTRIVAPGEDDYFVLKPKHSAFYASTLDTLLRYLGTSTLILTGIAGNICILFSANDAYMRDFALFVPQDCVVSNSEEENRHALRQMEELLRADTRPSTEIDFARIIRRSESE